MIQRFVLVKLKDEFSNQASREALVERTKAAFSDLPGVLDLKVGVPADKGAESAWDLSLVVGFPSLADIQPYIAHPRHRSYVDEELLPKTEILKAWNFKVC